MTSKQIYPSHDGTTVTYSIGFGFLERDHVKLEADGAPLSFFWTGDSSIELDDPPEAGQTLAIFRETQRSPMVEFSLGSTLSKGELDILSKQAVFLAEEALEALVAGVSFSESLGALTAGGLRLTGLADPVAPTDATTKQWVEALWATYLATVQAAEAASSGSASAAAASAAAALASQIASAGAAAAVAADAEVATLAAVTAGASADDAEGAQAAAELAQTGAQTARTGAEAARDAALAAQTGAQTARTGAEAAQTGAQTARTGAETAQTGAQTARTGAEAARDAALAAQTATEAAQAAAELARDEAEDAVAAVSGPFTETLNGLVPAPGAGDDGRVLRADGTWGEGVAQRSLLDWWAEVYFGFNATPATGYFNGATISSGAFTTIFASDNDQTLWGPGIYIRSSTTANSGGRLNVAAGSSRMRRSPRKFVARLRANHTGTGSKPSIYAGWHDATVVGLPTAMVAFQLFPNTGDSNKWSLWGVTRGSGGGGITSVTSIVNIEDSGGGNLFLEIDTYQTTEDGVDCWKARFRAWFVADGASPTPTLILDEDNIGGYQGARYPAAAQPVTASLIATNPTTTATNMVAVFSLGEGTPGGYERAFGKAT